MFKRVFVCALILAATFCLASCGGGEKPDSKSNTNADKAVLAYAELMTQGKSDNATAASINDADKAEIAKSMLSNFYASIAEVAPLNDQSAQAVTAAFNEKFSKDMKFTASVKSDDAEHPTVELKTTPIDYKAAVQNAGTIDEWIALVGMVGKLKADGATDDQLKANDEVQTLAVTALKKFVGSIPMQGEKTFDVTCDKVKGSDGKDHFAPADMDAFTKFLTGQQ